MSVKYKIHNPQGIYFLTYATVNWVDIFTREIYFDIIVDSLRYCQKEKGLVLHAWCIMTNHVHLIASASQIPEKFVPLENILRDHKKFTSAELIRTIKKNNQESRQEDLLRHFADARKDELNQLWQYDNHPIELFSNHVTLQKLEYIHLNPVRAGFVDEPWHYRYSSAKDYSGMKGLLDIALLL
jgi:putative transposase